MVSRTRTQPTGTSGGVHTAYYPNGTVYYKHVRTTSQGYMRCDDVVGNRGGENPLLITKKTYSPARLNGTWMNGGWPYVYDNWPLSDEGNGLPDPAHLAIALPSADAANILARTNPNRPGVSLPVAIAELKDLPQLLRFAGRAVATRAKSLKSVRGTAEANMAYQFGMAPLLSDLSKMLDFSAMVAKKRQELERLHRKGGAKRRVTLGTARASSTRTNISLDWRPSIFGDRLTVTEGTRWATVRWKPLYSAVPSSEELDHAAWVAAFGLRLSISDLWELLPWSWLIDWFTNIGDLLAAHRGGVPVEYSDICVMTRTVTTLTDFPKTGIPPGTFVTGHTTRTLETKQRAVLKTNIILPSASIPLLGAGQLSILASLSILRGAR